MFDFNRVPCGSGCFFWNVTMCIKHDGAGAVSRSFAFVCACGRRLFFSLIRVKDAQPVGAKAAAGKDARAESRTCARAAAAR